MRLLVLFFGSLCPLAPVLAAETAWQELAPNARARLISNGVVSPAGTTLAAVQIEMPGDVKTYWRLPGETGIPTVIVSRGPQLVTPAWPYPAIETKDGYVDFVYYGGVTVPFELTVGADPAATIALSLGICSEICIPASAEFTLPLAASAPDPGNGLRIRQALAQTPLPWGKRPSPFASVAWDREAGGLSLTLADGSVDPLSVIASIPSAGVVFGAPQKSPEPGIVLLPLLGNNAGAATPPERVVLTFMAADGPYEAEHDVIVAVP